MNVLLRQNKFHLLILCVIGTWISACSTLGQKPGFTSPDYEKAHSLMENEQYQAAIPLLQAVTTSKPELAEPYINLGLALRANGQLDDALKALETAVKLDPGNPASHHQLGILYREMGMFDESLAAYKKALKLDHKYALAHRNIGILYDLYLQQPDQALLHYKKYLELTGEPDKQVSNWIIDLQRRVSATRAEVSQ